MKKLNSFLFFFLLLTTLTCQKNGSTNWLVPVDQVLDGGPGKDGIPSIDNPVFSKADEVDFMGDNDLIMGIEIDGLIKAYPHQLLDWHEIVNDDIGNKGVAITYCPLTGTGIGWGRLVRGTKTTFGVSGLLYNSNLMPYDRESGSTWSQQRLDCVNGEYIGDHITTYNVLETTWAVWKTAYPDSDVLNTSTGFSRQYGNYPYGDYKVNHDRLVFPVSITDNRLDQKERVLGVIINGAAKAYPMNSDTLAIDIIQDEFKNEKLVIARSKQYNFNIPFKNPDDVQFEAVNDLPVIMKDNEGNQYDMFGNVIIGPAQGQKLEQPIAFIGYWFSWGTFYPGLGLYEE